MKIIKKLKELFILSSVIILLVFIWNNYDKESTENVSSSNQVLFDLHNEFVTKIIYQGPDDILENPKDGDRLYQIISIDGAKSSELQIRHIQIVGFTKGMYFSVYYYQKYNKKYCFLLTMFPEKKRPVWWLRKKTIPTATKQNCFSVNTDLF